MNLFCRNRNRPKLEKHRVIIWKCALNKHLVRIWLTRHSETVYIVRAPKVSHFICITKRLNIWSGWLTGLAQSGPPLCELARLGSTSDAFGSSSQVSPCFGQKTYIAVYSGAMLLICISCVSVNWEIQALKSSTEKAGLQEDHGLARGFKADTALWLGAQQAHEWHAYLHSVPLNQSGWVGGALFGSAQLTLSELASYLPR